MDQNNKVNLRWAQHQATLVSVFDTLLDKEKLTDCTISAEGRHLRAHKIILSACSPYFEELLTENNEKDPIIILHDVKYDMMKALMDFMYRGEVNVPQTELRGVLNLSESLQVRGLSGSRYVDDDNVQKSCGMNSPPAATDNHPSQPASVSCFTSGQNEPKEKVQSYRGCSLTESSQEGLPIGDDSVAKSIQNNIQDVNDSGSYKRTSQHACQEVITLDCDSAHHLPSQVEPTPHYLPGGPVYSPNHHQSVCNKLQTTDGEMSVAGNQQFLLPEAILHGKRSTNLSALQHEESLETKSENLESHMEVVEDLTLDDRDGYCEETVLPDKMSTSLSALQYEKSLETNSEDLKSDLEIVEDLTLDDQDGYCDDNVNNVQKIGGRNSQQLSSEALPSQHVSVPSSTEGRNEPQENTQLLRRWSPTVLHQEGGPVEVDYISKSLRNYRKSISQSGSDQGNGENVFQEVITSDLDSVHQLSSQGQILPVTRNSSDGPVYSPIQELKTFMSCCDTTILSVSSSYSPTHSESVCRQLLSSSGEMPVAENEQFIVQEAVLHDRRSANRSSQQQEVTVERNSEFSENNMEIVEDLTLNDDDDDDDDYSGGGDYDIVEIDSGQARKRNEGLTNDETVHNPYTCHCGKSYQYPSSLQRHMKYSCGTKERQFQCPRCSFRCTRKDHLKKHMRSQRCKNKTLNTLFRVSE